MFDKTLSFRKTAAAVSSHELSMASIKTSFCCIKGTNFDLYLTIFTLGQKYAFCKGNYLPDS